MRRALGLAERRGASLELALALVALLLAQATPGAAHTRSTSYATWWLADDGARVRVRVARLDFSRLGFDPGASPAARAEGGRVVARSLTLHAGDARCAPRGAPRPLPAETGWVVYEWRVVCPQAGERRVSTSLFHEVAPSHLHFARVVPARGPGSERVLTAEDASWSPAPDPGRGGDEGGGSFAGFVLLGVEHILTGWDHLAFVLALLLLARRLGEVAGLVTGFTVAHSLTLAVAALGWVEPEAHVVEALIGFSIALVAAENAWILGGRDRVVPALAVGGLLLLAAVAIAGRGLLPPLVPLGLALFSACHFALLRRSRRPARLRAAVAFAFGLVHGFGFAGVLAEFALPTERLVPALFGFNLGVELGQLGVVAVAWPPLVALGRLGRGEASQRVAELGSAAVCGLGLFWFVTRSF